MKVRDFISVLDFKYTSVFYYDTEGNRFKENDVLDKDIIKIEDSVSVYDMPGSGADIYLYVYVE